MEVVVLSDIHDNIWALEKALKLIETGDAERMLFLGDFCAPFTLDQLAKGFSKQIDVVFGNNDGDQRLLTRVAAEHPQVTLHGNFTELSVAARRVAITHYPEVARGLAEGSYDAVFYGHDHKAFVGAVDATLLANPGEIMGRFGKPTFGVYRSDDNSFSHIPL